MLVCDALHPSVAQLVERSTVVCRYCVSVYSEIDWSPVRFWSFGYFLHHITLLSTRSRLTAHRVTHRLLMFVHVCSCLLVFAHVCSYDLVTVRLELDTVCIVRAISSTDELRASCFFLRASCETGLLGCAIRKPSWRTSERGWDAAVCSMLFAVCSVGREYSDNRS